MNDNKNKIRDICKSINVCDGQLSDEYLFTVDAVDIFFYNKNIGAMDIKYGFTDGPNDGGIDYIYSDTETMYLVQGKSSDNLPKDDIFKLFEKMLRTINDFESKHYDSYSKKVKSAYLNAYEDLNDDKNIALVLFTNSIIDEKTRELIYEKINQDSISNVIIFDHNDIENKEAILFQGSDLIKQDSILLYMNENNKNNILSYGENGIIVNIKASSLKELYLKYENKGLFSYNLREHIRQKNVDDGIDKTIREEKDRFWYYNNGITIGCEDFEKDGYKLKLYNFSIINGAQTTSKIGQSKIINKDNDFALVCKIIKSENSFHKENDFIGRISEYSNSQKPIKQRDLKSNAREQKILQMNCANNRYPLSIEIKRGVLPINYKKVEKWQRISNEYLGQLIYACIFQNPGKARNSKNTMFSSNKVYNQLFKKKHDYDTLYDLVRLGYIYDCYADNTIKKENDLNIIAIIKNGKLTILAITIYLLKKERKVINNYYDENLHKDNLKGLLISDYLKDDLSENLNELFGYIIRKLSMLYESKKESMKFTSYSNFFKTDSIYEEIILKSFDEIDKWDREKLSDYIKVFVEKKMY